MSGKNPNFIQQTLTALINVKERLLHHVTDEEIDLIKNTHLFDKLDKQSFDELLKSEILVHYPAGDLILKEGDIADEFYIIVEGSVRVFTLSHDNIKIPLARLNKGEYFGEQALLGDLKRTRNANVETITNTSLIKINKDFIIKILKIDTNLRDKLKKISNEQIIHKLSSVLGFYQEIKSQLQAGKDQDIIDIPKDKILFKSGDPSDYVYIILEGSVNIILPSDKTTITLKKGHLFGELGVLQNDVRSATAISSEPTRLLRISPKPFKALCEQFPLFNKLLQTLQNIYLLPNRGVVEQAVGKILEMDAITTIYKLNEGRTVIANHVIEKPIFLMEEGNLKDTKQYSYEKDSKNKILLKVVNNHIVSIKHDGYVGDISKISSALLDQKEIPNHVLEHFKSTGEFKFEVAELTTGKLPNIVCDCMFIKRETIEELIKKGIKSLAVISEQTGACTVCGSCRSRVLNMLGQDTWIEGNLLKGITHKDNVISYYLQPKEGQFKSFTPGSHVVIQVRIGDNWVERAYTLSDLDTQGKLRITIKKAGFFTKWLFTNPLEKIFVYCSQPQGNFVLKLDTNTPVLCIAGGIGITPFITFAKFLQKYEHKRRMHIIYVAPTKNDLLFMDEFNEITNKTSLITLTTWEKNLSGTLPEETISKALKNLENVDIYICGPEGFEVSILNTLGKLNQDLNKVHVEKFTYANPILGEDE